MDPEKRASLVERRESLRRRRELDEQLYGLTGIRDELTKRGEAFEILYWGEAGTWTPDWVPSGYSRIAWELVPPASETFFDQDLQARGAAFREALVQCAGPDESLLFVFEGRLASFRMARTVAERNSELILDGGITSLSPLWVTAPPKQWLIEVSHDTVRLGGG